MIGINTIMKFMTLIFLSYSLSAQRGTTGQEVFANRFPKDVEATSNSSLLISNETDHDIIALIRGQYNEYLRHIYIRTGDEWVFEDMPITRFYVQFKAKEFYFEDLKRTVVILGKNILSIFFMTLNKKKIIRQ